MDDKLEISRVVLWAWVSTAALAIGSLGPWVSIGPFTKSGTSGDGGITLIAAAVIAIGVLKSRRRLVLVFAALALAVGVYDTADVSSSGNEFFSASVGWGLIMVDIACVSLVVWFFKARTVTSPAEATPLATSAPPVVPAQGIGDAALTPPPPSPPSL